MPFYQLRIQKIYLKKNAGNLTDETDSVNDDAICSFLGTTECKNFNLK